MCRPDHFDVTYSINPWMDPGKPVDRELALLQWEQLVQTYRDHGHRVDTVPAVPGLPDMVFAANGGLVVRGRALVARFRFPERLGEAAAYLDWFRGAGYGPVRQAEAVNEGEGDFLVAGSLLLAGTGYRSMVTAVGEVSGYFGMPVLALELVDPRFYHLDTALCVVDDETIAYYPGAFSERSCSVLEQQFPGAIRASEEDALVLGLNAFSDGGHVYLPAAATGLQAQLREVGFDPVAIELTELLKGGGGIKCCTLVLRGRGFRW